MKKQRLFGALALSGMLAGSMATMVATPAHAARATLRSSMTLVGGEDPTIDPLNPAVGDMRWQSPVRKVAMLNMDPARFPASIPKQATPPCVANLSLGTLKGTAPVTLIGGFTTAELADNTPGTDGQLGTADVVCNWTDAKGVVQHHETHWKGELGTAPVASVVSQLNLGSVKVGAIGANQDLTLTNVGNAPLHVASAVLSGTNVGDFNVVSDGCSGATLAPAAGCTVTSRLVPTVGGLRQARLTFTDDSPDGSQVTALSGTGLQAGLLLNPLSIDFGSQRIATNSVKTITAQNSGNDTLNIASVVLNGVSDFKIVSDSCSKHAIAPSAGCSITVRFTPGATGTRSTKLTVNSDAPATFAHVVSITGKGSVL